jgi:phage gp16-like protein
MTRKTAKRSPRSIELAKIHIGAKEQGLIEEFDDSAYRDMLWSVARVRSAKDLDATGRRQVIQHLTSLGWVDPSPSRRGSGRALAAKPQVLKIRALWAALGDAGELKKPGEESLRAFVKNYSKTYHPARAGYDAPDFLPSAVASRIIEHLKKWCQRMSIPF